MNDIFAYRKEYELINGYKAEFSLDRTKTNASLQIAWSPDLPSEEVKTDEFLEAYRKARNDFWGSLGMNVMIVEI
jgi:hypothetical protein